MNIPDLINDFLVDVREHDGFADDMHFDLIAAEVFKQKVKLVIEECAKIAREEFFVEGGFAESRSGEEVAEYIEARIRALAGDQI